MDDFEEHWTESLGFKRLVRSTRLAFTGISVAWVDEKSFKQVCFFLLPPTLFLLFFQFSIILKVLLVVLFLFCLVAELLNSAIEALVDISCPDSHPLAAKAKDTACAAVFLTVAAWLVCFLGIVAELFLFRA